jgi:hypothetical protein
VEAPHVRARLELVRCYVDGRYGQTSSCLLRVVVVQALEGRHYHVLRGGRHALQNVSLALLIIGGDEQRVGCVLAQRLPVVRAPQSLEQAGDGGAGRGRQHHSRIEHHDGREHIGVAGGEVKGDYAGQAMPDHHRLLDSDPMAGPGEVVGEELYRVVLLRLVASAVPTQVHRHDAVSPAREALELGREVGVVAAPSVDKHDGRLPFAGLLVEQR